MTIAVDLGRKATKQTKLRVVLQALCRPLIVFSQITIFEKKYFRNTIKVSNSLVGLIWIQTASNGYQQTIHVLVDRELKRYITLDSNGVLTLNNH